MAAQTKQQKANKEMAEMILRVNGEDYNKWLDEKHVEIIVKGTETIRKLTEMATTKGLPPKPPEQQNSNTEDLGQGGEE